MLLINGVTVGVYMQHKRVAIRLNVWGEVHMDSVLIWIFLITFNTDSTKISWENSWIKLYACDQSILPATNNSLVNKISAVIEFRFKYKSLYLIELAIIWIWFQLKNYMVNER